MYTILRNSNGQWEDGLILSASADVIRMILRCQGDTAEFRRVFGEWTAEDGSTVELESLIVDDGTDLSHYVSGAAERAQVAN